jgi:hypothetical protein
MNPEKRKQRLQKLLEQLDNGKDVCARDMKTILSEVEYVNYEARLDNRQRVDVKSKPKEIKIYEKKLLKAILAYAKYDKYSGKLAKRDQQVINRMKSKVDIEFHNAYEYLQELLGIDPSIQCWLDRTVKFDFVNCPTSVDELPRVITSRSLSNLSRNTNNMISIRDVKISVLKDALDLLNNPELEVAETNELDQIKKIIKSKTKTVRDYSNWKF